MGRSGRSDVSLLLQEAAGIELLASEADVSPRHLEDYWALSADLIALVTALEEFAAENPNAGADSAEMVTFRQQLRAISSRLHEVTQEQSPSFWQD